MMGYDAVRLFRNEEYAKQFANGDLYMSRLSFFREAEDDLRGVGDPYEGRRAAKLPEGTRFFIDVNNIGMEKGEVKKERKWVECPKGTNDPFLTFSGCDDAFILCATDISAALVPCDQDGRTFAWSTDYLGFEGQYESAVLFRIEEVERRLSTFAKARGIVFLSGSVEYSDGILGPEEALDSMSRPIDIREIILRKRTTFSNQYEYRFALLPTPEMIAQGIRLEGEDKMGLVAKVGPIASSLLVPIEALHGARFMRGASHAMEGMDSPTGL